MHFSYREDLMVEKNKLQLHVIFEFTLKVFTPCMGVLHVIWSAWCVDIPWLTMMDIHNGVRLAIDCETLS